MYFSVPMLLNWVDYFPKKFPVEEKSRMTVHKARPAEGNTCIWNKPEKSYCRT